MPLIDTIQAHAPTTLAAAAVATVAYSFLEPLLDNGPPGPYLWPVVGALPQAASYLRRSATHEFFDMVMKQYGPIAKVRLTNHGTMYVTNDAELARRILTSPEFVRSKLILGLTHDFFDNALFALTDERWKVHRKMLQPAFGPLHLRHATAVSEVVAKELADAWSEMIDASTDKEIVVDSFEFFKALTLDFMWASRRAGIEDYDQITFIVQRRLNLQRFLWGSANIDPSSPAVLDVRGRIHGEVKNVVLERRKQMAENGGKPLRSGAEMDLLDRLLISSSDGTDVFSEDEIAGEVTVLVKHPEIQEKLAQEIDRVYEELKGNITTENMYHFRYLDGVLKETQRLYPIVSALTRQVTVPVEALGYRIPAGSRMTVHIRSLHRHPAYWDRPDDFIPERWEKPPVPGSFVPFGDGQHNCIGQKLAQIEMRFVLIHLLRRFRFEEYANQKVEFVSRMTFGLKNGFKVRVLKREH
nr:hypothetical protein HK105_007378 [Polyrhizophydium stewartii]